MPVRFYHKRKSKISYCDKPVFLDCETSWNHDADNPVCWIVSIQVLFDDHYHLFRKPEELIQWYLELYEKMNLSNERRLVTYIHNASYDLSYLAPYIQRYLPDKEKRFGIYDGEHKIITYQQGALEFKCTYLLSGMSLAKWSKEMNCKNRKQIGLYDYDKILYQDSELSENELSYDKLDVYAMAEAFDQQLKIHDDIITTVPLTSTGYSRRLLRKETDDKYYKQEFFFDNRIDIHTLLMYLHSYAGGFTHTNRHLKSKVIEGIIGHNDFRSHYPSQIMAYGLPWGKTDRFYHISEHDKYYELNGHNMNIDDILKLSPEYFTVSHIRFYTMYLKDPEISMPFMQFSKIKESHRIIKNKDGTETVLEKEARFLKDNGRILSMVENEDEAGYFDTYIDGYTLKIIQEQYNVRYKVIEVIRTKNKPVPANIANVVNQLFKDKSDMKIIHKKYQKEYGEFDERTIEASMRLNRVKALLNSIYGCFATLVIREQYDMDFDLAKPFIRLKALDTDAQMQVALDEYYSHYSNFIHYPIGVSITASARFELYEYIKTIGYKNVLYCDTDSIFYIKTPEIEARIEALNKKKNKTAPYITNVNGDKVYYDVFEDEPDLIAFKSLHSKCYGFVTTSNELKCVIAGVPERSVIGLKEDNIPIYLTREEELAGITKKQRLEDPEKQKYIIKEPVKVLNNLQENFKFKVNSGVTAKYIHTEIHDEVINGHTVSTAGGCIIRRLDEKLVHDWDFTDDVEISFSDIDIAL